MVRMWGRLEVLGEMMRGLGFGVSLYEGGMGKSGSAYARYVTGDGEEDGRDERSLVISCMSMSILVF